MFVMFVGADMEGHIMFVMLVGADMGGAYYVCYVCYVCGD